MAIRRGRPFRPGAHLIAWQVTGAIASFVLFALFAGPAYAQRELLTRPGQKGQIVIDQLSGFRGGVAGAVGENALYPSLDYYGPIGFSVQHYSQAAAGPTAGNSIGVTATTFWLAPSLDVFVINHLSVGGMVQIAYTTASESIPTSAIVSRSADLPSNTSFSIMPRVGWMFALTNRWAIWPRLSMGYASNAIGALDGIGGSSVYGFAIDLDAGVLFRVNETFFLRLAPELGWIPAGANSTNAPANVATTRSAEYVEFSLSGGIGVMFDL
jgi:hypothetical protein